MLWLNKDFKPTVFTAQDKQWTISQGELIAVQFHFPWNCPWNCPPLTFLYKVMLNLSPNTMFSVTWKHLEREWRTFRMKNTAFKPKPATVKMHLGCVSENNPWRPNLDAKKFQSKYEKYVCAIQIFFPTLAAYGSRDGNVSRSIALNQIEICQQLLDILEMLWHSWWNFVQKFKVPLTWIFILHEHFDTGGLKWNFLTTTEWIAMKFNAVMSPTEMSVTTLGSH